MDGRHIDTALSMEGDASAMPQAVDGGSPPIRQHNLLVGSDPDDHLHFAERGQGVVGNRLLDRRFGRKINGGWLELIVAANHSQRAFRYHS